MPYSFKSRLNDTTYPLNDTENATQGRSLWKRVA